MFEEGFDFCVARGDDFAVPSGVLFAFFEGGGLGGGEEHLFPEVEESVWEGEGDLPHGSLVCCIGLKALEISGDVGWFQLDRISILIQKEVAGNYSIRRDVSFPF